MNELLALVAWSHGFAWKINDFIRLKGFQKEKQICNPFFFLLKWITLSPIKYVSIQLNICEQETSLIIFFGKL